MQELSRQELATKSRRDFKQGTILRVNKYLIFINGLKTYAESDDKPMIALKEYEMPRYIREFVF